MNRFLRGLVLAMAGLLCGAGLGWSAPALAHDATDATAQDNAAQDNAAPNIAAPAQAGLPPLIPTAAFASQTSLSGARLSPDGSRFAYSTVLEGDTYLVIHDGDTRELLRGVNLGELEFNWFEWAGSERLLFSMSYRESSYRFTRLYAMSLADGAIKPLALRKMGVQADDLIYVEPNGRYVLVSMADRPFSPPAVWRFDLDGEGAPQGVMVQASHNDVGSWVADETGVVRIGIGFTRLANVALRYRPSAQERWRQVARTRLDRDDLKFWDFLGLRAGSDKGYSIAVPEGGERRVLMEFDFSTGQTGEIIYQAPDADVSSVYFDETNQPIAISTSGEVGRREWLDPELEKLRNAVAGALSGRWVTVQDYVPDRSRFIVRESGPADPGALYIVTPAAGRLDLFAELRPQVPAPLLSEPRAIRYTARDGTSIPAYLTLPRGRGETGLPLIVYPHGGPYGIRSTDSYSDTVQLLANRGYAVIEPNFRGSGGYGTAFEQLGDGQIGRAMQDDLDDAVAHLVAEGIVDPARVCIVGASYGGFAALWGAIRNPEIYRCAASWAGVTHFKRQLSHDRDYLYGRNRRRWQQRVGGDTSGFDLDDVSPAVQVARLTRPVLLGHGEKDNTVPFDQFELMTRRARSAGIELETLVLEESSHGFGGTQDEQAWYDALETFLGRHNPAG